MLLHIPAAGMGNNSLHVVRCVFSRHMRQFAFLCLSSLISLNPCLLTRLLRAADHSLRVIRRQDFERYDVTPSE